MKLKVRYNNCREEFNLKKTYIDRPNLISELGEYFNLNCPHCHQESEYHANDVKAYEEIKSSIIGSIVGVLIIIFTTLFAWNMVIGVGIIAARNMNNLTSNTKAFNDYRVNRTRKN